MIILLIITVPSAYPPALVPKPAPPIPHAKDCCLRALMGYCHLMITSAGNLATNGCLMAIPGSRYSKLTPLNKVYDCFCCWFRCCLTYQKPFSSVLELTSLQESLTVFPFFYVTFRKRSKRLTSACSSISWISCFTCACIRSNSIVTHRIDATAMGVGRTLVDIWENVVKLGVKIRDFAYAWWQFSVTLINYSASLLLPLPLHSPPPPPNPSRPA